MPWVVPIQRILKNVEMLAAGVEDLMADEVAPREIPLLRAEWCQRGEPAPVTVSG